ncbi:MAG: hypothetical protein JEZ00_20835 [Anaerolineaceae bacterium]|nr:hypothetical protein [Anaerolineaceae bacterium]
MSSNIGSVSERINFLNGAINSALTDLSVLYKKLPLSNVQIEALSCAIAAICYINDKCKTVNKVGPSLLPYLLKMDKEHSANFAENFLKEPDESAIYVYFKEKFHSTSISESDRRSINDLVDTTIKYFGNSDILPLISSPYEGFAPGQAVEDGKIVIVIPNFDNLFDIIFCQWMAGTFSEILYHLYDPFLFVCEGFESLFEINWTLLMAPREGIRTAITIYDLSRFTTNENAAFIRGENQLATILFMPEQINTTWIRNFIPVCKDRLGADVEVLFNDWLFDEKLASVISGQEWENLNETKRMPYENVPGFTWSLLDYSQPVSATSLESKILSAQKEVIERAQNPPLSKKAGNMLRSFFTDK